jgi:hypothetical protein
MAGNSSAVLNIRINKFSSGRSGLASLESSYHYRMRISCSVVRKNHLLISVSSHIEIAASHQSIRIEPTYTGSELLLYMHRMMMDITSPSTLYDTYVIHGGNSERGSIVTCTWHPMWNITSKVAAEACASIKLFHFFYTCHRCDSRFFFFF